MFLAGSCDCCSIVDRSCPLVADFKYLKWTEEKGWERCHHPDPELAQATGDKRRREDSPGMR